jgi:hypothetical protein
MAPKNHAPELDDSGLDELTESDEEWKPSTKKPTKKTNPKDGDGLVLQGALKPPRATTYMAASLHGV